MVWRGSMEGVSAQESFGGSASAQYTMQDEEATHHCGFAQRGQSSLDRLREEKAKDSDLGSAPTIAGTARPSARGRPSHQDLQGRSRRFCRAPATTIGMQQLHNALLQCPMFAAMSIYSVRQLTTAALMRWSFMITPDAILNDVGCVCRD